MPTLNPQLYPDGVKRACVLCGSKFTTFYANQKYCSLACSRKTSYAGTLTKIHRIQAICAKYKMAKGCVDCGYRLHPRALQFDHIPGRGKKVKDVSSFTNVDKMWAEIAKCEVRCANCHAIKTMERHRMTRALTWEQEQDIKAIVARLVTYGTLNVS